MFLSRVYKQWKTFFWAIILALVFQFFFMVKGVENIPFFLYHMYAYAHQPKDSFNVILVKTPKGYLNPFEFSGRESEMLMNNTLYFIKMKKNHWNDPLIPTIEKRFFNRFTSNTYQYLKQGLVNDSISFEGYCNWWKRYFISIHQLSYDSISIVSGYVKYQPNFSKSPIDSTVFTVHLK